jgi:hypothetical protein
MAKSKNKLIDFGKLCSDFRISYRLDKRGWMCVPCPFCQDSGDHLGYHQQKGYFFCYKCGWHPINETIKILLNCDWKKVYNLLSVYSAKDVPLFYGEESREKKSDQLCWPDGLTKMSHACRDYLKRRNFDAEALEKEWKLMATQYWGQYSFRIIAPVVFEGQPVSWQSRSILKDSQHPYIPCPSGWEVLPYKHLLYGIDKAEWKTGVVVEGITGVWRLGPGAVATFGVRYTSSQLLLISRSFEKVLILFDGDEAGCLAADKMGGELTALGQKVEILEPVGCDSGDMPDGLAERIMREVRR